MYLRTGHGKANNLLDFFKKKRLRLTKWDSPFYQQTETGTPLKLWVIL